MNRDEIREAYKKEHGDYPFADWNTERNFIEIGAQEILKPTTRRVQWKRADEPDEAIRDAVRNNVQAVEVETHRYDEQNY